MHSDVIIIGAGILGLAHAYAAAKAGKSVLVLERYREPTGASLRSFGSIWPIGQAAGKTQRAALRSRREWLSVLQAADCWYSECGALFLAYSEDEQEVLREFEESTSESELDLRLVTAKSITESYKLVNPKGLRSGLCSKTELCVDPREVMRKLPGYLAARLGVRFEFGVDVREVEAPHVRTNAGIRSAPLIVVCAGDTFESLYPSIYNSSGITRCKLQMLRLAAAPNRERLGPIVCSGLTYCHYPAFQQCPSLPKLFGRLQNEVPQLLEAGIHVMIAENERRELVVGDSHEYGQSVNVFNDERIDQLMLEYLARFISLPDFSVSSRWLGVYAKHKSDSLFRATPEPGVSIVAATSGNGLTMAFSLAQDTLVDLI